MLPDICRLTGLRTLNLSRCYLSSLPNKFGSLGKPQELQLNGCTRLESLPDSFLRLTNLQTLGLSRCDDFPIGFPGSLRGGVVAHLDSTAACGLRSLRSLDLSHSQNLISLSDQFALLLGLEQLDRRECEQLVILPNRFGRLSNLRRLHMACCKQLSKLPPSFGDLSNLQ